ncbi:MAG: hypothetical protein HYW50_04790 [Candidatus Diapherotrites archaeon]|nr:hypothetical protein [Candidatus Diapherotrites archaeon]
MVSISNKKLLIGFVIIVSFLYLVFNVSKMAGVGVNPAQCDAIEGCPHEAQLNILLSSLPLLLSFALVVGAATYYFMAGKVESKEQSLKKNTEIILKFLSEDEKKLVNLLVENRGKILQSEATRLPEMNKVKSHRVVQKLLDKGVLEKEQVGKTNVLKFSKEIKEGLF